MDEDSVVWDDSFSVGFSPIDNQHKELVLMTNELFQNCKEGDAIADMAIGRTFKKAMEYAKNHFSEEEGYLSQVFYPDLAAHKKLHFNFMFELVGILSDFEAGNAVPIEMARFLKTWLLNHIAVSDKKYAPYVAKLANR